jgi:hypothetical protein
MANDDGLGELPEEAQAQTMERLRAMFTANGVAGYSPSDGPGVRCPFCPPSERASYIHIERRVNFLGDDEYDAEGRYGLGVRGDLTAIEFSNETCAHRWALAFGFHKGATFVRVVRLSEDHSA